MNTYAQSLNALRSYRISIKNAAGPTSKQVLKEGWLKAYNVCIQCRLNRIRLSGDLLKYPSSAYGEFR